MSAILTIWVACALLLASGGTSTTEAASTTINTTQPPTTTTSTTQRPTTTNTTLTAVNTITTPTTTNTTAESTTTGNETTTNTTQPPITTNTTLTTTTPTTVNTTTTTAGNETTTNTTQPTITTNTTLTTTTPTTVNTTTTTAGNETTTNTTQPPITTNTTLTTTTPTTVNTTTTTAGNETATDPPAGGNGTTAGTTTKSTASEIRCSDNPCGNMTCVQLHQNYICRCPTNYFYNESLGGCVQGESLYGELQKKADSFDPNTDSAEYTKLYNEVMQEFKDSLKNYSKDFMGTVILEMRATTASKARSGVDVLVRAANMFFTGANLEEANKAITDFFRNNGKGIYTARTACDSGWFCDLDTTTCSIDINGNTLCSCKDGFYSSLLSYTACRECAPSCTGANHQQCLQEEVPRCACLPGYKKLEDGQCKECDFGYSGEKCADNFLLILVIVGAVLGGVVLILLGTIIGLSVSRSRREKSEDRSELMDRSSRRSPSPVTGNIFPKVTINTNLDELNRGVNVYDDNEEFSRSMPRRDYDENPWYEMDRK